MGIVIFILLFSVVPLLLGQPWKNIIREQSVLFIYLCGFLTLLAVIELLGVPMTFAYTPLHIQASIYSLVLAVLCLISFAYYRRSFALPSLRDISLRRVLSAYTRYERIYIAAFFTLLAIQVFFALFYDMGAWRSDDGTYTVISSAALADDGMYLTDANPGTRLYQLPLKYAMCAIYVFYAYVSYITGVPVSVLEHTVCNTLFLLMAYAAFYLLAKTLFDSRENRFIFLIFLSLSFLFGLYSHYSVTFRLVGVIWQGKAFLAVVILPFLLYLIPQLLRQPLQRNALLFMPVISLAAVSLTLGGIVTTAVVPTALTLLYVIRTRRFNSLLYVCSINVIPALIGIYYILSVGLKE